MKKPNYKCKDCFVCGNSFKPTSPTQKFCLKCRDYANKMSQKLIYKKRRYKNKPTIYTVECPSCGITFTTTYSRKKYCGSEECEKSRIKLKNKLYNLKRDKKYMRDKGRNYYKNNRSKCLLSKAKAYRKKHPDAKEYAPGKVHVHTFDYINNYVLDRGYKLLSTKYVNNREPILLECPEGHVWQTTFHNFQDSTNKRGSRCAICYNQNNYVSNPESKIRCFIEKELPNIKVIYNDRMVLSPKELDFYFPENNFAIEVCGLYWHGERSSGKHRDYHYRKMISCYDNGIRLMTVFEDEIINKPEIVLSRIRLALGAPSRRIFARKCTLLEVTQKVANDFYSANHIIGKSTNIISYGLVYKGELVCVGSLGKDISEHQTSSNTLQLKRFCTLVDVSVVGGIGKIFNRIKKFAIDYGCSKIVSYCDMRYANIMKPVYELLGFELLACIKYTPHYFKGNKRFIYFSFYNEKCITNKSKFKLTHSQGYDRIWDCGYRTYVYEL